MFIFLKQSDLDYTLTYSTASTGMMGNHDHSPSGTAPPLSLAGHLEEPPMAGGLFHGLTGPVDGLRGHSGLPKVALQPLRGPLGQAQPTGASSAQ